MSGCTINVRQSDDRLEIALGEGFTRADLRFVKTLPGRRWSPGRRVWIVPHPDTALRSLLERFGKTRVQLEREEDVAPTRPRKPPVPAGLERVRQGLLLRGYSPRTRNVYLGHVRRFIEWRTGPDGCTYNFEAILEEDAEAVVRRYLVHLAADRGVSRSYHNQVVSALRFLFETVLERPRLAVRIPRPKKKEKLPDVLSPAEVARVLDKPRNLKHRALLVLLYSAGLRVGELVRLRPEDLDEDRRLVRVRGGKGGKDRNTLLARRALEVIRRYRAAYPTERWLFPGARPERHLTTRSVQRVVARAAEAAGIRKRVTPHTLRHSFATHLLEGGTNLRIIQELLGHRSARTTQVYTHVAQSTLQAVRSPVDNLPG